MIYFDLPEAAVRAGISHDDMAEAVLRRELPAVVADGGQAAWINHEDLNVWNRKRRSGAESSSPEVRISPLDVGAQPG